MGAVVLAVVVVLTAAAAWWLRARSGALRATAEEAPMGPEAAVLSRLGVRPGEADLTVVQFSSAFCGPCLATRVRLQHLQASHPGLAVVHVDAENSLDAVRELDVRRTPTLFWLERNGRLIGRSSGAPRPAELAALVEAHTGASS